MKPLHSGSTLFFILFFLFVNFSCQKETMTESITQNIQADQSQDHSHSTMNTEKFIILAPDDPLLATIPVIHASDNCDILIQQIADALQPFADKHCQSYYYSVLCQQDGAQVYVLGLITPKACPLQESQTVIVDEMVLKSAGWEPSAGVNISQPRQQASADIKIEILDTYCYNGGQFLQAYDPSTGTIYSDTQLYKVKWYKNGVRIPQSVINNCVCGGNYTVTVITSEPQQAVGIAFYSSRCGTDDE